MTEIELNTALLTNMEIQECLSQRGGTSVYQVKSTKSDQLYVLKHISVPESPKQVEALILTGAAANEEAAQSYYQQLVSDYQAELEQLEALATSPNLDSFRSYEIRPKEEGIGFDVFVLAEFRTTLEKYLTENNLTQSSAVNLAMDLCNALTDLRAAGLIHRNIRPSNIYLSNQGHFMIGDLGIAKIDELKYCSMPETMLSSYSAPELFELMANVNPTIDMYAVGLILYRIYNANHAPFEDEKTSAKAADKMRITGQALPAPMFADYEMAEIILKICAFAPEDRYATPEEMKQAFVDYMMRNQVGDTPIVPPIIADEAPVAEEAVEEEVEPVNFTNTEELDEEFVKNFSPDNDMLNSLIESVHRDLENDYTADEQTDDASEDADAPKRKRKKQSAAKWLPTILTILVVLGIVGSAVWYFFIRKDVISIDSISAVERTVDSISVEISLQAEQKPFEVVCTDAYGNTTRQSYSGSINTFNGLVSGTQYTISVEGLEQEHIAGVSSIMTTTKDTTGIISFTTTREAVNEVGLTFITDGSVEPNEWSVLYEADGEAAKSKVFSGHNVTITGLKPDTEYRVTLTDPADIHLTGNTTLTCHTVPSVEITKIRATISRSTAELNWDYEGDTPSSWNIVCTGTDGYEHSVTVEENAVTLEGLKAGQTYTILITSDSMVAAASTHITPNAMTIIDLQAEGREDGTATISWVCEVEDDVSWLISYMPENGQQMRSVEETNDTSIELHDLIPNTTYLVEIQEATGAPVGGTSSTSFQIPDAAAFEEYGFKKAYVSTWLRPEMDNWTDKNLKTTRTSFKTDETIAFACLTLSPLKNSDDTVTTLLVVRNSNGDLIDYYVGEEDWNNMWSRDMYLGELLRTPQTPGEYTLTLYFNGKLVKTDKPITFKITE